ncbi:MAG: septal ring lytic transglycosylase RlpA family protein, partial [Rhodospirillales bacterium]
LTTDDAAHAQMGQPAAVYTQRGEASWYGPGFHGRKTASGERFNQHGLTAAHRKLPLGTKARVTNLDNGKSVEVKINDRGPYVRGRIIDLSKAAAERLGMKNAGITPVRLEVTKPAGTSAGSS